MSKMSIIMNLENSLEIIYDVDEIQTIYKLVWTL